MSTRKFAIGSTVFLILILSILAVGQYDYNFSKLVMNQESLLATTVTIIGGVTGYVWVFIGLSILFITRKNENKTRYTFTTIFGGFLVALFAYIVMYYPTHHFLQLVGGMSSALNVALIIGAVVIAIAMYFVGPKYKDKLVNVRREAFFIVLLVASTNLIVNILKILWGRPRMRTLTSFDEFHYWYQIAGPAFNDDLKSFPSGHTANAFCMLLIYPLAPYIKAFKPVTVFVFAIIWGVCVAFSRNVLGAHFLSDVLVGGYITIYLFLIFNYLFYNKWADKKF